MIKRFIVVGLLAALLGGCTNYLSDYRTVYRIETTDGERYYSKHEPSLNSSADVYEITDLDGNDYRIKKDTLYRVEKYRHRK